MINAIKNYMFLPATPSEFESKYLERMNAIAVRFFALHLPVFFAVAYFNETGPMLALALTTAVLVGPIIALKTLQSKRMISTVMGVAAMFMGGLLVHFGQGPAQIEMHFYFFVVIALLAVFANPMVVVAAAVTAALHHTLVWLALPASVFNYDAPFWVVGIHAAFVVLESVAACFIARSFFDNVIGLEKKVADRTAEVEARNNDMRMILDSVKQGFFTIDPVGGMSEERSAAVVDLLGPIDPQDSFIDVLRRCDEKAADWMEMGLDEVFGGFMPPEVTIDQLPSRVVCGDKNLSIHYDAVETDGEVTGLAVVVTDITPEVEREKLEAESREMIAMIDGISTDRAGFLEFFQEAQGIIDSLRNESRDDLVLLNRRVHTLKGNAAIFGLQRVADACHVIEDHISETGVSPEGAAWTRMFGCWATARGNLRRLISDESTELRLTDQQYTDLLLSILNGESKNILAPRVAAWRLEATEVRLQRIGEQARRLASRLGKGDIEVEIQDNRLRTDPEVWSGFWGALVHVVRNAVDHGLESTEDRMLAKKTSAGKLTLRTTRDGGRFVISIADDGRGVNWDSVRKMASDRGLPCQTQADLTAALLDDGFSTASAVTDVSGRGVGLAAIQETCQLLDGTIEIVSETGKGSEFRFSFPDNSMAPNTYSFLESYGIKNADRNAIVGA